MAAVVHADRMADMKSEYHKAIAKHGERRWVESIPQCVLTYLIEAESTGLIKIR